MKKIRLTEQDLHKIIKSSVKRILLENYPWAAKDDPRAPYNQPEYDFTDIASQKIEEEIDSLSEEFYDWFFTHYDYDDDDVDEEGVLYQASHDPKIRQEYENFRWDDVVDEISEQDYDNFYAEDEF